MIVFIYGISGSGKTYLSKILKNRFGFYLWDGDNALTDVMLKYIKDKDNFKKVIWDEFTKILKYKIEYLHAVVGEKNLVVPLAIPKAINRKTLMETFPEASFIYVDTSDEILLERTGKLNEGLRSNILVKRSDFELPNSDEMVRTALLGNNYPGDDQLIERLKAILHIEEVDNNNVSIEDLSSRLIIYFESNVTDEIKKSFKQIGAYHQFVEFIDKAQSSPSLSDKNNHSILRASVEEQEEKATSVAEDKISNDNKVPFAWLTSAMFLQDSDLKIKINKKINRGYIYSRNNSIKVVSFKEIDFLIQFLLDFSISTLKKIQLRNKDVIAFRNKTKVINKSYQKFFINDVRYFTTSSGIDVSTHLIKAFNENRNHMQVETFIATRLFKHKSSLDRPTIIYFPGSAYSRMLYETVDKVSYALSAYTACNVFTIHYRLSPENIFPTPLLDAFSACEYILENANTLGINDKKFIISGYSSGASIAMQFGYLTTINKNLLIPLSLALICPTLDFSYLKREYEGLINNVDRFISVDFLRSMHGPYLSAFTALKNAVISPLYIMDEALKKLPQIFIFSLEKDIFSPQHEDLILRMNRLRLSPVVSRIPELDHCSWWDNILQWELLSDWISKTFILKNELFSKEAVLRNKNFFEEIIASFKVPDSLAYSSVDVTEKHVVDVAYQNLVFSRNEAISVLKEAEKYPNNIVLQIYSVLYCILSQNKNLIIQEEKVFNRLQAFVDEASAREKLLIDAVNYSRRGLFNKAIEKYTEILVQWPEDILSGMMVDFHSFVNGNTEMQLIAWDNVKAKYIQDHRITESPLASLFLAHYGHASVLVGQHQKGLFYAGLSLALNPFDPFAQYTLAHACAALNEIDNAILILEKYKNTWSMYGDLARRNNYFNLAIYYLQKGNFLKSFQIYEVEIKKDLSSSVLHHIEIINLLWRFDLSKIPDNMRADIQRELLEIYNHICESSDPSVKSLLADKHLYPFLSLTYLYLCIRVGDTEKAKLIRDKMISSNAWDKENWEIGARIADGLISFYDKNYKLAYNTLNGFYDSKSIGANSQLRFIFMEIFNIAKQRQEMPLGSEIVVANLQPTFFYPRIQSQQDQIIDNSAKLKYK